MDFKKAAKELVAQMTCAEKLAQMKYNADAIPRLGVAAYNWWNEALHGVARAGVATVFPQAIGLAAMCSATATPFSSAISAIFFNSNAPPQVRISGWITDTPPALINVSKPSFR